MERRRVGFQVHIRAAIAQLRFSLESDSQHFVGHASLVLARESKKRSGNVRYSALLCSACGFKSARKSVYSLTQQQSQEPELYKRGANGKELRRFGRPFPSRIHYCAARIRGVRSERCGFADRDFSTYDSAWAPE